MLLLSSVKGAVIFSLVWNLALGRVHLKARQDVQGGVISAIPLCVVTAEGTLFTATSGVLPTDGCPSTTQAAVPFPTFITIPASISGSSDTFSQTVFADLATLTVTETVTTDFVRADSSGGTSTVTLPIVVGPGGVGFVGVTGALPTDVSIDTKQNSPATPVNDRPDEKSPDQSPGDDSPGGDNSHNNGSDGDDNTEAGGPSPGGAPPGGAPPGGDNSNNDDSRKDDENDDGDDQSLTASTASVTSTQSCVLTQVACTQTCTISSSSGASAPTTICGDSGLCRRQVGEGGCTSTTSTITLTSFTTASASVLLCQARSCGSTACGISPPNVAHAVVTNAPGDQIPSLESIASVASKRTLSRITRVDKIIKRFGDRTDPTSIRQLDFTDPNTWYDVSTVHNDYPPADHWYSHALILISTQGPTNYISAIGNNQQEGDPSSTKFDYSDLRQNAITTGSGPSEGCTSVLVYSERGVWIAHFWELEQMQAADFDNQVIDFIRLGRKGVFEGLSDVIPSLFSGPTPGTEEGEIVEVPLFSGAVIFTPSYRSVAHVPAGQQMTDPIYGDQVRQIKRVLVNLLPGFTAANANQKINVATYKPVGRIEERQLEPFKGLLTFEYVPQHISSNNGQCEVRRAIRYHIEDVISPIIEWNWPMAELSRSKSKRQKSCPMKSPTSDLAQPASFFDISKPAGGVVEPTPSMPEIQPEPTAVTTTTTASDLIQTNGPVLCSNWLLSANGVQVGTNCDGDPNKTVTMMLGEKMIQTSV
ncbi:hypothetical protein VTL71DRAFT_16416 [Oculimacula yallundae]|uniref:Uncharacterized protein n=1 Tax=Oculimacula yallundae TaxID=86028 RepID=A0ABR4CGM6_9HELO